MLNELLRQWLHIGLGLLAFIVPYISLLQFRLGLSILVLFVVIVGFLVPVKQKLFRKNERFFSVGAVSYFGILLLLSLVVEPWLVAASWVVLAFGDGSATLVGVAMNSTALPWNHNKSWVGLVSFMVVSMLALCILAFQFTLPVVEIWPMLAIVSFVAAGIESLPLSIDDNISIPVVVTALLFILL